MIRVGISQRVVNLEKINESRDELDQRWTPFLQACGITPVIFPNLLSNIEEFLAAFNIQGVILSGGNNFSSEFLEQFSHIPFETQKAMDQSIARDRFEENLLKVALKKSLPVLGVCRGMQIMNLLAGGSIRRIENHVAVRHLVRCEGQPDLDVNSFHDFGMLSEDISNEYRICYESDDGVIESIEHNNNLFKGIMWHPEREEIFKKSDIEIFQKLFVGENQ